MARKGSSFGLLMLVVTLVVVLLLVARSWKSIAPTATRIPEGRVLDDDGKRADGEGTLPGLGEMQEQTDQHARQVQEAAAATN